MKEFQLYQFPKHLQTRSNVFYNLIFSAQHRKASKRLFSTFTKVFSLSLFLFSPPIHENFWIDPKNKPLNLTTKKGKFLLWQPKIIRWNVWRNQICELKASLGGGWGVEMNVLLIKNQKNVKIISTFMDKNGRMRSRSLSYNKIDESWTEKMSKTRWTSRNPLQSSSFACDDKIYASSTPVIESSRRIKKFSILSSRCAPFSYHRLLAAFATHSTRIQWSARIITWLKTLTTQICSRMRLLSLTSSSFRTRIAGKMAFNSFRVAPACRYRVFCFI